MAGQSGDRSRAGWPILAGGARASGLPRALSERLHLPFCAARLGVAETLRRGGVTSTDALARDRAAIRVGGLAAQSRTAASPGVFPPRDSIAPNRGARAY